MKHPYCLVFAAIVKIYVDDEYFVMKKNFKKILWILILCSFVSCGKETESRTEFVIGTVCTITVPKNKNSSRILDECFKKIKRLETVLSANDADSELSFVNQTAAEKPVTVSPELLYLIQTAKHCAQITDGAFEPAIGRLVKLWNIGFEHERVPAPSEIENALYDVSYKNIVITGNTVFFENKNIQLDLGGIAKGYIADCIVAFLKEKNIQSAIINLGGNVYAMGKKFFTDAVWHIGLRKPYGTADSYNHIVKVTDTSVVTSGIYERYFEENGLRYHHILDVKTGYPVRNNLVSVSVICESSTYADALATAFLVMGYEKATQFIKNFTEKKTDAIFIFDDGSYQCTNENIMEKQDD